MELEQLIKENTELKERIIELEEKVKKYTNSESHKRYYEKNKEQVKEKANGYLKKLAEENPDKLREYRHKAYLKQKEKREENRQEKETISE
jgi:cell division septum initiation protein DivIVA